MARPTAARVDRFAPATAVSPAPVVSRWPTAVDLGAALNTTPRTPEAREAARQTHAEGWRWVPHRPTPESTRAAASRGRLEPLGHLSRSTPVGPDHLARVADAARRLEDVTWVSDVPEHVRVRERLTLQTDGMYVREELIYFLVEAVSDEGEWFDEDTEEWRGEPAGPYVQARCLVRSSEPVADPDGAELGSGWALGHVNGAGRPARWIDGARHRRLMWSTFISSAARNA